MASKSPYDWRRQRLDGPRASSESTAVRDGVDDALNRRPTNCTLSRKPSAENPHGTDKVGLPLKLNGWV
jgi:hypothetical protein